MHEHKALSSFKPVCGIDEKLPPLTALSYAVQHLFAMFSGNILAPVLVANLLNVPSEEKTFLIQCSLLAAALATFIQVYRIGRVGSGLPIVMGTSNAFIPTVLGIASRYGVGAVLAASFVGALFETFIGCILPTLRKYFTNLVLGVVVLSIGLTLIPIGIAQFGGGNKNFGAPENLLIGTFVLVVILACNQCRRVMVRSSAVLLGLGSGYVLAWAVGMVNLNPVSEAAWVSVPWPMQYGWNLHWDAAVAMLLMYVVTAAETMADTSAITMGGEGRQATHKETEGAVLADGVGSMLAALCNAFPNTSYSQNVGVVALTGIMSRHVVGLCAVFLLVLSFLPKLSALLAAMPAPVLGGASLILFSMVASSGLLVLRNVEYNRRNMLIIAVALGLSLGLKFRPDTLGFFSDSVQLIFAETGVATATLVALVLEQLFPKEE